MSPPAGVVDGLLAGRYRLGSLLGSGASGEVWSASDERLGREVAVKVLRAELADDQTVRARFRAEAHSAGRLHHPGIAAVFDYAEHDDGAWLVMELVPGRPLSDVLREQGRLPVDRTLDLLEQAAAALQAAHDDGVVHRDVKPGNLLLREDGRLVMTDFGIARAAGAATLTRTGQVVGTAAYLSPEQASGEPVTPSTDLYSLGVVAYECLSGARPFERDDPVAVLLAHLQAVPPPLHGGVPGPVAELVDRLLAKDPADRPPSALHVRQEVAALRRGAPVAPAPTAMLPAATRAPAPARPAVLGLAARPGQRRAVRATALALGLLAVALGVRDALDDTPAVPSGGTPDQPASTAPAAPDGTSAPAPQQEPPRDAPVVVPEVDPAPQPVEAEQEQREDQGEQEQEQRQDQQEQREDQREQDQEQREDQRERDQEQREQEREQRGEGRGTGQGRGGDG